jgi:CubicO group peptidase (beta-lactamase class C family)
MASMRSYPSAKGLRYFSIGVLLAPLLFCNALAQDSLADQLQKGIDEGSLKGLHSVVSMADNELIASAFFDGEDELWGRPQGMTKHSADTQHDLRSVTKSIVGLLYAIARDKGVVPDPSAGLYAQFPAYEDLASDKARQKIKIEHALTMSMGTAWNENLPYTDPNNSEIAMENASDRYRFILEQAIIGEPGVQWDYSGGATAIVGKLIANGAGKSLDAFAKENLFTPLGISQFTWVKGRDNEPSAASGLRLRALDLAKVGQLIADGGMYKGKRIVSEKALATMLKPRMQIGSNFQYGHFWYLLGPIDNPVLAAAFGNGGQRLSVNAKQNLVTVIFAGNYNQPDDWKLPVKVIEDYIVPELRKAGKL